MTSLFAAEGDDVVQARRGIIDSEHSDGTYIVKWHSPVQETSRVSASSLRSWNRLPSAQQSKAMLNQHLLQVCPRMSLIERVSLQEYLCSRLSVLRDFCSQEYLCPRVFDCLCSRVSLLQEVCWREYLCARVSVLEIVCD